ncbi:MAG: hypothetical protein ACYS9Y_14450, partial [Planctomycetota bacterium]
MRNTKRIVLVLVVVLVGIGAVCASAEGERETAKRPTAMVLLDRYAETQDKLTSSYISKSEISFICNCSWEQKARRGGYLNEIQFDGNRISLRTHLWGNWGVIGSPVYTPKSKAVYQRALWDGEIFYNFSTSPTSLGSVSIHRNKKTLNFDIKTIQTWTLSSAVNGFFSNNGERIDSVLRRADTITVREKTEKIGRTQCYVMDAEVPRNGKYTVWIDPEHGHNIAKAKVHKGKNDLFMGEPLGGSIFHYLEIVSFEKIDDVWVAAEANLRYERILSDGNSFDKNKCLYKLVEYILNPDFDENAFVPDDIKDGAEVNIVESIGGHDYSGCPKYKWLRGARYIVDDRKRVVRNDPNEGRLPVVKILPPLKYYKIKKSPRWSDDKIVVMCFIDIEQRASQECAAELKGLEESLAEKGVVVVLVQASDIEAEELDRWKRKNKIRFALGRLLGRRIKE